MSLKSVKKTPKSAVVVGYTGAVGKEIVKCLRKIQKLNPETSLDSEKSDSQEKSETALFSDVSLIGRRTVDLGHGDESSIKQVKIDFDDMQNYSSSIIGKDVAFCALGTTRGKSGNDGFRKVDHDYIINFAKLAKAAGIKEFHLVSAYGANHKSSNLYIRTKGEVEEELKSMNFDQFYIYQPGFLDADREERRLGEWFMCTFVMKAVNLFAPDKFIVKTPEFAAAMVKVATSFRASGGAGPAGGAVIDNKSIVDIAREKFLPAP